MKRFESAKLIDKDTLLHVFTHYGNETNELHRHDFLEIVYVRSGTATQYVNEEAYEVGRGDVLLIDYGESHRFVPHADFVYVNLCFDPMRLDRRVITPEHAFVLFGMTAFSQLREKNGGRLLHFDGQERGELETLLTTLQTEYTARRYAWQTVVKDYLHIFFQLLLRRLYDEQNDLPSADRWEALSRYIDGHLCEDLTLATLSRRCFYNPSYFSRAFREHFGMNLTDYVGLRRVSLAAKLAKDRTLTVEALARRCGFESKSALYRAFLKYYGMPFGTYRKTM